MSPNSILFVSWRVKIYGYTYTTVHTLHLVHVHFNKTFVRDVFFVGGSFLTLRNPSRNRPGARADSRHSAGTPLPSRNEKKERSDIVTSFFSL